MTVLPNGLPGNVAADELIESAWGNAVADFCSAQPLLQYGITDCTIDPSSSTRVNYPVAYKAGTTPAVSATWYFPGGYATATRQFVIMVDTLPASFGVRVLDANGAPFASGTHIFIMWLAMGERT